MTLDEMIAWLENEATRQLLLARRAARAGWPASAARDREHAATLLTIENALRAVRDLTQQMHGEDRDYGAGFYTQKRWREAYEGLRQFSDVYDEEP
jgi:hypothetical protein